MDQRLTKLKTEGIDFSTHFQHAHGIAVLMDEGHLLKNAMQGVQLRVKRA